MVNGIGAFRLNGTTAVNGVENDETAQKMQDAQEKLAQLQGTKEEATVEKDSNKTSKELAKEIENLKLEQTRNYNKMKRIEAEIQSLIKDVTQSMKDAKELQEAAVQEHQKEAESAVEENLAAYVKANKEGGSGMSKEELEANIASSMPDSPNLAKALSKFVTASRELNEIDTLLDGLNCLVIETDVIEQDICSKEAAKVAAEKKEQSDSCDPIGFFKDGARYDFIIDDGSFDSTSDFLGANGNWADMEALDSDGDKVINASELKDAGIKMVKNVNGQQQIVDVADEFGEDFKIDLTTYQKGGSFDGIDTSLDTDNDGTVNQELLGTYTIHIGDEDVKGYNTLDDVDYLASEYGVNIADATKLNASNTEYSNDLQVHENFFNEYSEMSKELSENLEKGYAAFGVTEATVQAIKNHAKAEGAQDANIFMKQLEAEENKKLQEEKAEKEKDEKAQEAKEEEAKKAQEEKEQENPQGLTTKEQKLFDAGIPVDVIEQGDEAIKKYAEENNIVLDDKEDKEEE